jgi:hypothetical protein
MHASLSLVLLSTTLAVVTAAAAAAPILPSAQQTERYTDALLAEARLEETLRALRACLRYAESAEVPSGDAGSIADRAAASLRQARLILQPEALAPDLATADLAATLADTQAAWTEAAQAVERLRGALDGRLGARLRRASPAPPAALPSHAGVPLVDQLVFGALGPTQAWPGWAQGPEAWSVFHALGLQFMSPWFGHYWAKPDTQVCDPGRVQAIAAALEGIGFPLLVWLEPEFDIDSLWSEIGAEMYLHDATGRWQKRTRINNTINVFHPRVREEMCRALERLASGHRGDPRILGYELVEEPALRFDASDPGSGTTDFRYGGYSAAARSGFQKWLQIHYGTSAELNRRWGTAQGAFADIAPPAELARREGAWTQAEIPLLVEFQRFRAAEHAECFRQMVAALHRANPGRPVIPQFTSGLFGDPLGGVDLARMAEAGWDILSFHTDTAFAYVYSLARYLGKPIWNDEFIWTASSGRQPYITAKAMASEHELRSHAASELWRNLMWGARGLVLFNLDFAWNHPKDGGDWNNQLLNDQVGKRIPRYAAAVFATVLPRVRTFFPELRDSQVVDEGVLLLEPTTALYAAVPTGTVQWWGTRMLSAGQRRFYRPRICPERYLTEGREDLGDVRVVIAPPAPYVPTDVSARLHAWVGRGGTLVTLGAFATHDQYGHPQSVFVSLTGAQEGAAAAPVAGRHVVIALRTPAEPVLGALWDAVDAAVGPRAVSASDPRLELMLRRASGGHLLLVLNPCVPEGIAADIRLGLPVARITDLTVDGGAPVPFRAAGAAGGLSLVLEAGEARVFWLE